MKFRLHRAALHAAILFAASLSGAPVSAQCETDSLTGSESDLGWPFAGVESCLSLRQDRLVVGSEFDRTYVYSRSGSVWTEEAILPVSGSSVDSDGGTIVVGDGGATIPGIVGVFVGSGSTWTIQQTLSSTAPELDRLFGDAVAISGDTLAVGQPGHGNPFVGGMTPGDVHVFVRSAGVWSLQQVLTPSDQVPLVADNFGQSVAIQGDRIVVGAEHYDEEVSPPGAVYVFERSGTTWTETARLTAAVPVGDDSFGHAVALDGATLAVAAKGLNPQSPPAAAFVFVESGGVWSLQAELPVPGASSIALHGDHCIVGALLDPVGGGSASIFQRTGTSWSLKKKLYLCTGTATGSYGSRFGTSVGLDGLTAAVQARFATPDQVFILDVDPSGCPGVAFSGAPTSGLSPLTVDFTDLSTGSVSSWDWDFGDGATSDLRDPSHVYDVGLHTVSLLVEGPGGKERDVKEDYIDALIAASATIRNGSGVNGLHLTSLTLPVMGTSWDLEIDHSNHTGAALTLLRGHLAPLAGLPTGFGELLIDIGSMRFVNMTQPAAGTADLYSLSIPVDLFFAGAEGYFQGAILGGFIELTNAVDAVVGF